MHKLQNQDQVMNIYDKNMLCSIFINIRKYKYKMELLMLKLT